MDVFRYGLDKLTVGLAMDLALNRLKGRLTEEAIEKVVTSRKRVELLIDSEKVVYGITTGFGALCSTRVDPDKASILQHNLLKSHAVGVGDQVPRELVKMMLILKAHSLAMGFSGIQLKTLERIMWHIEEDILPIVPCQGSVGASGDLAPLAHLFLPLIGLGEVHWRGHLVEMGEVLKSYDLPPITLGAKEGLALINGTQFMAAYGIASLYRFQSCLDQADFISAMMIETLQGSIRPFDAGLHAIRPHAGSLYVAERMRLFLGDSEIMKSHEDCQRVQDPYSLRCIAQVHGASRDVFAHVRSILEVEINSVTDNPVILEDGRVISGGNFHGQPIALAMDYLSIAASELGNISDRRIYLAFDGRYEGIPQLLMKETGVNSGFMILQYTTAALVSENKSLAFPASVDSIPTSLGQEDHVSMGSISGRKCFQIIRNLEKILALELLCAAQGLDFRRPLKSSPWIEAFHERIRRDILHREFDDLFSKDIDKAILMVQNGELLEVAAETSHSLGIQLQNRVHDIYGIY